MALQRHAERIADRVGDLLLDFEDVLEVSIELPRPQVVPVRCLHELRRDTQPFASLAHAAFEHGLHVELAADVGHVGALAAKLEGGHTRGHPQVRDHAQRVEYLLGHAFAEVGLIAGLAEVEPRGGRLVGRQVGRVAHQTLGRELVGPREYDCDGQAQADEHDEQRERPVGEAQGFEAHLADLHEHPAH